jgi:hypothetical protein
LKIRQNLFTRNEFWQQSELHLQLIPGGTDPIVKDKERDSGEYSSQLQT